MTYMQENKLLIFKKIIEIIQKLYLKFYNNY
jgi:hypothetical protein